MAEQSRTPMFNLKTAKGLIDDVSGLTEDVLQLQKLAHDEKRFWEGLKMTWKAAGEVGRLKKDLALAIELASKAATAEPGVHLDDGTTPETVIAQAHFQNGLIEFRLGKWEEALQHFEDSQKTMPTQEALFNIALIKINRAKRVSLTLNPFEIYKRGNDRDKEAKKRGVSFFRRQVESIKWGVEAMYSKGEYATDEVVHSFNQVIEMNPESDLAVEAGKIIARLGRQ